MRGVVLPITRLQAAQRALLMQGRVLPVPPGAAADATPRPLQYRLGYGGKDPNAANPGELSWNHVWACDCSGFLAWCIGVSRHHDAFPHWGGSISTDSIWESAKSGKDWFAFTDDPQPGDLIVYPGHRDDHPIGHCGVVTAVVGIAVTITDCHGQHHGADHAVDSRPPKLWLAAGGRFVRYLKAA